MFKFNFVVMPRGHKQKKLNQNVHSFIHFVYVFSAHRPRFQVEFYHIKGTLLKKTSPYKAALLASVVHLKFQLNPFTPKM